jgi:hypothetical protein
LLSQAGQVSRSDPVRSGSRPATGNSSPATNGIHADRSPELPQDPPIPCCEVEVVGTHPFDPTLPVNTGILADQMVATTQGVNVRRVIYQDPETRKNYERQKLSEITCGPLTHRATQVLTHQQRRNRICLSPAWMTR